MYCPSTPLTLPSFIFFFFNDPATTEIYTLSLHDALPISDILIDNESTPSTPAAGKSIILVDSTTKKLAQLDDGGTLRAEDRKSTRLNSSHMSISYAVFCLKKKKRSNDLHSSRAQKSRADM